jgi:hypothetical protein
MEKCHSSLKQTNVRNCGRLAAQRVHKIKMGAQNKKGRLARSEAAFAI